MKLFVVACLVSVLCGVSMGTEIEEDNALAAEAVSTDLDTAEEKLEISDEDGEDLEADSEDDDTDTALDDDEYGAFNEKHAIALMYGDLENNENEMGVRGGFKCERRGSTKYRCCIKKKFKIGWGRKIKAKACGSAFYRRGKVGIEIKLNNKRLFKRTWSLKKLYRGKTIKKCKRKYGIIKCCIGLTDIQLDAKSKSVSARVEISVWKFKIKTGTISLSW